MRTRNICTRVSYLETSYPWFFVVVIGKRCTKCSTTTWYSSHSNHLKHIKSKAWRSAYTLQHNPEYVIKAIVINCLNAFLDVLLHSSSFPWASNNTKGKIFCFPYCANSNRWVKQTRELCGLFMKCVSDFHHIGIGNQSGIDTSNSPIARLHITSLARRVNRNAT